ncbi:hypothetical protein BZA77DRAFT_313121 [Pyronema omphalodes]|nr:hypothetical protein BZA77DRAFT_313121 [Pyronema omphalodes]
MRGVVMVVVVVFIFCNSRQEISMLLSAAVRSLDWTGVKVAGCFSQCMQHKWIAVVGLGTGWHQDVSLHHMYPTDGMERISLAMI